MHDSTCLRANLSACEHAQAGTHRQARTGRGEVSKSNHYFPLWYIFIDSYVYHKLILLIPQLMIKEIGKKKNTNVISI
jgi:hypothetical protein